MSLKNQHGIKGLRILEKSGWLRKCPEVRRDAPAIIVVDVHFVFHDFV